VLEEHMNIEHIVMALGLSQLIQLPATLALASARVLDLSREIERLAPIARAIVRVLGFAAITVLVGLGVIVAMYPGDIVGTALGRGLLLFLGVFWSARFGIQLWYGMYWPSNARRWHWLLCGIFAIQGPGYCFIWSAAETAALNHTANAAPVNSVRMN
jgi:hypothetical protein